MVRTKEDIKKYQKEYRLSHKQERKEYDKKRYTEDKDYFLNKNNTYYVFNTDKIKKNSKDNYYKNKDRVKLKHKFYIRKRRKTNINFRLRSIISSRVLIALKKNDLCKNNKSILKYLPYSIQELKDHLESQFEPWMNWENHRKYKIKEWDDGDTSTWKWQIDHIIPQSKLLYTSMEDDNFKKCWELDNLSPLSAKQNLLKSNK